VLWRDVQAAVHASGCSANDAWLRTALPDLLRGQVRFELFRIVSNCFELFRIVSKRRVAAHRAAGPAAGAGAFPKTKD
jgi:hypothetical protein